MRLPGDVGLGLGAVAALVLLASVPAVVRAAPAAQPASGPGSLTGVWISSRFTPVRPSVGLGGPEAPPGSQTPAGRDADGKPIPLQPWAAKVAAERRRDVEEGHPRAAPRSKCLPDGTPQSMLPPASLPLQIIESPGQITVLFEEFNQFRIIYMNEKHAEDPDPGYFGNSVGHWEGDTLVVDTIGLNDQSSVGNDLPHTSALHVVERIRRVGDVLELSSTFDDPKTFTRPWSSKGSLKKVPGLRLQEYFCDNDRNTPDASGKTSVQLPPPGR